MKYLVLSYLPRYVLARLVFKTKTNLLTEVLYFFLTKFFEETIKQAYPTKYRSEFRRIVISPIVSQVCMLCKNIIVYKVIINNIALYVTHIYQKLICILQYL